MEASKAMEAAAVAAVPGGAEMEIVHEIATSAVSVKVQELLSEEDVGLTDHTVTVVSEEVLVVSTKEAAAAAIQEVFATFNTRA